MKRANIQNSSLTSFVKRNLENWKLANHKFTSDDILNLCSEFTKKHYNKDKTKKDVNQEKIALRTSEICTSLQQCSKFKSFGKLLSGCVERTRV